MGVTLLSCIVLGENTSSTPSIKIDAVNKRFVLLPLQLAEKKTLYVPLAGVILIPFNNTYDVDVVVVVLVLCADVVVMTPAGPCGPCGPMGPTGPWGPWGPAGPTGPTGP